MTLNIAIIGGGLAGTEIAWQFLKKGHKVTLFEMRSQVPTPAHKTEQLAELVCSNSFKSTDITTAHGLLKAELQMAHSLLLETAYVTQVPAGGALAVDRVAFSSLIEEKLCKQPLFTRIQQEITNPYTLQDKYDKIIIATGPLTSPTLSSFLEQELGNAALYFYDAIAPSVFTDSIDFDKAFFAARYDKGTKDYINCPLTKSEYYEFIEAIEQAEKTPYHDFENKKLFEGCMPIEEIVMRGKETLAFGPFRPVGLTNPHSSEKPYAVLQLRCENKAKTTYSFVGCQTRMTYTAQANVFKLIPALANASFASFGSMHRNTFINAPKHLQADLSWKQHSNIHFIGQITGVEGYMESVATAIWCALSIERQIANQEPLQLNPQSMICALIQHTQTESSSFQPKNSTFGLLPNLTKKIAKKQKRAIQAYQALRAWKQVISL